MKWVNEPRIPAAKNNSICFIVICSGVNKSKCIANSNDPCSRKGRYSLPPSKE